MVIEAIHCVYNFTIGLLEVLTVKYSFLLNMTASKRIEVKVIRLITFNDICLTN